jgi:cell division transport system permease protein
MRASFVMSGVATGVRRNLTMTVALILNTAIALSFAGGAILATQFISRFQTMYGDRLNTSIYLCNTPPYRAGSPCTRAITDPERRALQARLRADPAITSVQYLDLQAAYKKGKQTLSGSTADALEPGFLPASFIIKLKDNRNGYTQVTKTYAAAAGVDEVQGQDQGLKELLDIFNKSRLAAAFVAVAVMVCAMLIMANAVQLAATQRRNETGIMRLVGATRWMVQLPFVIEAMLAAAVGGVLGIVLDWVGTRVILGNILERQVNNHLFPNLDLKDVILAGGVGAVGGVVLAALTAFVTLRLLVRL